MLRFTKKMLLSIYTEARGCELLVGFAQMDAHSFSWLSSPVLTSSKLMLFKKMYLLNVQISVIELLCLCARVFRDPLSYKVSPW